MSECRDRQIRQISALATGYEDMVMTWQEVTNGLLPTVFPVMHECTRLYTAGRWIVVERMHCSRLWAPFRSSLCLICRTRFRSLQRRSCCRRSSAACRDCPSLLWDRFLTRRRAPETGPRRRCGWRAHTCFQDQSARSPARGGEGGPILALETVYWQRSGCQTRKCGAR